MPCISGLFKPDGVCYNTMTVPQMPGGPGGIGIFPQRNRKAADLNMRAVITVIGKDMVGILARVSSDCARHHINVLEVTQSILQDMFAMIMMVDISNSDIPFTQFADEMAAAGREMHLSIHAMHEDIFNSMHQI